jgi:predicted CXXCH cytochrome family protein
MMPRDRAGMCMKRFLITAVIWAVLAPGMVGAEAVSARLSIVVPPDKSIVESESISIVMKLAGEVPDQVQITLNNRKLAPIAKPYYQNYVFKDGIRLSSGINRIKVVSSKDGNKIDEVNVQIFYKSDLSEDLSGPPPGFKQYTFHVDLYEKNCKLCHQLDFRKIDSRTESAERSPCYTCHKKKLDNYAFVHGPTAVWSCLICHNAKSKNPKMAVVNPVGKICVECHENTWSSMKFQHGPTAAGDCTACHDPHGSNQNYFLRMSPGDLCASCHEDILSKPHVISSVSGSGGHPLRKYPDPYNPGREFNCASCHNPHGENSPKLLKGYDSSMPMERFCKKCHMM